MAAIKLQKKERIQNLEKPERQKQQRYKRLPKLAVGLSLLSHPAPSRSLTFCCSCAAGVESSSLFCSQRAFQTVVLLSFSLFLLTVADFVPVIVVAVALELVFSLMKIPRVWKRGREFGRAQPESQKANYSRC